MGKPVASGCRPAAHPRVAGVNVDDPKAGGGLIRIILCYGSTPLVIALPTASRFRTHRRRRPPATSVSLASPHIEILHRHHLLSLARSFLGHPHSHQSLFPSCFLSRPPLHRCTSLSHFRLLLQVNRKKLEADAMESKKRKLSGAENKRNLKAKFSLSDAKNIYKDAILPENWKAFDTLIFNEWEGLHDSEKIAAFDFDGCLANTSVKRIGADAWSLMYPCIPEKLQELYNGGHKLVIFTNESNIERWKNKRQQAVDSKIGRLENFIKLVKVPIQVFIACGLGSKKNEMDDPFRKPMPGMWSIMAEHFNSGKSIDMSQSFYVGDAAGRRNDHSDADTKFAKAIGLKFFVPEEYFIA